MKQDKKLILGMALLFFITFVSLGTLVVTEKLAPYYTDKIKIKMEKYLNENYKEERKNLKLGKITYKAQTYTAKVTNIKNKDLYFNITYKNKKITDTYKKDYLEGKTILSKLETTIEKEIKENLNINTTITFPLTLNKYTKNIQQNIINNNIEQLNIYNIKFNINSSLQTEEISTLVAQIINQIQNIHTLNINPNYYTIKINSKKENKSLTIKNLTEKNLNQENLTQIIYYIMIEDENSIGNSIIKDNNIKVKGTSVEDLVDCVNIYKDMELAASYEKLGYDFDTNAKMAMSYYKYLPNFINRLLDTSSLGISGWQEITPKDIESLFDGDVISLSTGRTDGIGPSCYIGLELLPLLKENTDICYTFCGPLSEGAHQHTFALREVYPEATVYTLGAFIEI